jgi:phosphate regulon transcriptional regulator PhoB
VLIRFFLLIHGSIIVVFLPFFKKLLLRIGRISAFGEPPFLLSEGRFSGIIPFMRNKARILVVDDEKDILRLLTYNLKKEGYRVDEATEGADALRMAREHPYDLIVLDLMLPGLSGMEVCRIMKQDRKTAAIPIIMLTARSEESDKVAGLETGADDYITKPFGIREFLARVRTVLRRSALPSTAGRTMLSAGPLQMDMERHRAAAGETVLDLSATEFDLLRFLMERRGRVMSRDQILDALWNDGVVVEPRTVDVHIRRLRAELEKAAASHYIETVRGVGYRFAEND